MGSRNEIKRIAACAAACSPGRESCESARLSRLLPCCSYKYRLPLSNACHGLGGARSTGYRPQATASCRLPPLLPRSEGPLQSACVHMLAVWAPDPTPRLLGNWLRQWEPVLS